MSDDPAQRLTERQLEVLELLAKGLTNPEIAGVLGVARATVKNHVSAVLSALDVTNRTEAVGALSSLKGQARSQEPPVPGFGQRPAIAVLPFDALDAAEGDAEQAYFADGLVEDLITRLAAWRWFPVIARNSTFAYRRRGEPIDVSRVGRELGARYVVEGSSRRSGDRVRVTAQLIDAESGAHVIARRYDRKAADVFAIQDEIVEAIVSALAPAVARVERLRAVRLATPDLGAWECVQRGLHHYYGFGPDDIREAQHLFERALRLDPSCAPAYTALALNHMTAAMFSYAPDPATAIGLARDAARQAVTLDPEDGAAHAVAGSAMGLLRQTEQALVALRRSLELDPSSAFACFAYGLNILTFDGAEEASRMFERALRLSPRDPLFHDFEGAAATAFHISGRHEEAIAMARSSMASLGDAGFSYQPLIAASLARLGRLDEARSEASLLQEQFPNASLDPARLFVADEVIDYVAESLRIAGFRA